MASPLNGREPFEVSPTDKVSMNLMLFSPSIFTYIEEKFPEFLDKNKNNLEKCEYLIPEILFKTIEDGYSTVDVLETTSAWYGVTYKEDADAVKKALKDLVNSGEYPNNLWEK